MESENEKAYEYQYYGIHPKNGRLHIDTKRFKKILERMGATEFLHDGMFANRTTTYLIPKRIHRDDYNVNLITDLIHSLNQDWEKEFKPLFKLFKTPRDVYENERIEALMCTSCADDIDEIETDAFLSAVRRQPKYGEVVNSLYCQFICKICTEVDRFTLLMLKQLGYKENDFSIKDFFSFSSGLIAKSKTISKAFNIRKLDGFNSYNMLHKINNFLKHNTIKAYDELKKFYPANVKSIENKTSGISYENGMFAGDWIIIKDGYIEKSLKKLVAFFKDYCSKLLDENLDDADWNYDDFFRSVYNALKQPNVYFGYKFGI